MAMNKKERAEMDRVVRELKRLAALRWTAPIRPDMPVPQRGLSTGYLPVGIGTDRPSISEACSSPVNHGYGHAKTTTQGARSLYSTRLLALRALRHEVECECANLLAQVDEQISMERANLALTGIIPPDELS
jgi:hypothetical protein